MNNITIKITPAMANKICRNALREYAVEHGLDGTKKFSVVNENWFFNGSDDPLAGGVIYNGQEREAE